MNPSDDTPAADLAAACKARVDAETGEHDKQITTEFTEADLLKWAKLGGDAAGAFPYAQIARNKVMRPAGSETPLIFRSHFWEPDITGWHQTDLLNRVTSAITRLAAKYEKPPSSVLKIKNRLMTTRGQHSILEYAFSCMPGALTTDPAEHNKNKNLLAFKNGVIDLNTGILKPGRPEDKIDRHIRHDHPGNVTPLAWEKFLLDIFGRDIELIHFLQRFLGYALTGTCAEQKFMIMTGLGGNGKGTLLNTLRYVLGDYYAALPAEMVIEQRTVRSPSAASPHLMLLQGARLAVPSEVPKKKLDVPQIKWLASTDPIPARGMNQNFVTFDPSHTLILACNDLPTPPASDKGFWRRALVLEFPFLYVDDPQAKNEKKIDLGLEERLKAEAPAIAVWLVNGALRYARDGLKIPASVKNAVDAYRSGNDYIGRFITEACCTVSESRSKLLYDGFRRWYANEINADKGCPAVSTFTEQMERRFDRIHKKDGNYYIGIGLNSEYFNALG